jgi:DNA-directed RNA polymerase II subunit RPB1
MKSVTVSKIVGLQFSLFSPEEIIKGSVAEITTRDTYVGNKPVINGLFDPRMGVLEPGLICPTDGLDYMQTPGYFGHISLAKPVFYIQYLSTTQKILRCVCFKCSKLLVSKQKYKHALKMQPSARWKYVFELTKNIKRCGEDTEDGCGYLQPKRIKKEGMASLYAEWENSNTEEGGETIVIPLTPELVLKIFKRISEEDITFMGFSPLWSRPDWMICQVLAVPPPAVRPSVKHDAQQRSEDDLSHILVNIIKTNKTLLEKIQNNAQEKVIDDWSTVLQFHVASLVDNKIPGVNPVTQRSGRPLKPIKERLNGKGGRMRGNLMAKRVDFSARSVITADPNISIKELGIPMKIAMNITKPVEVNPVNRAFLTKLVINGPDIWPGAKILEKSNGVSISLRYIDRKSIVLEDKDIVHRHMMDGDPILFNRQPTLHRMSMMCHIARIMKKGDTFRMNVADTKPYNADFDGDEMNLHMPQDAESESELLNLAAVPWQIISPGNNSSIIGIYQDSMLGAYRFTREQIDFSQKDAMNILMMFKGINLQTLRKGRNERISNFEILSQILPPLSLKVKNKQFNGDKEDMNSSNNVVEIKDGIYLRGQIDKGIFGSGTKGLIQRIANDFGNMAAADFIDNIQNIVTKYMKQSSFSVGISDLITDDTTNKKIVDIITTKKVDVKSLIQQVQIGVFENNSGKTNEEEFETKVNNLLSKAQAEAGRAALENLSKDNRFVIMFNAGSKGSEINIQQMTACLGQQNVDGKRIPYGFEHRTLPHYTKYDDGPSARGFVESSYINGLNPQELFFHAMGGRIGLIDTAVKTSTTGYIQRRLVKGMEDCYVGYDMTVRNNKDKIIQFRYGEDSIDTVKVETQELPLVDMSIQDVYAHFSIPIDSGKTKSLSGMFVKSAYNRGKKQEPELTQKNQTYTEYMLKVRGDILKNIFNYKSEKTVHVPVAFTYIIQNIIGQQNINSNSLVDLTLLEAWNMLEESYSELEQIYFAPPTPLFKALYYYHLAPKSLLITKRFNRAALEILLKTVILNYKRAIIAPGEMVGMIAAQSIGEPTTQMTLNTFHFAGVASKSNVTRGVPRIEEILSLSSSLKNPSLTVYLKPEDETSKDRANVIQYMLEHTKMLEIVKTISICFDPDDMNTLIEEDKTTMAQYKEFEEMVAECSGQTLSSEESEKSKWILRMELDPEIMLEKNITMDDVNFTLNNSYKDEISCIYSDYNSDKLIFRIRMTNVIKSSSTRGPKKVKMNPLDQSDQIYILKNFQERLLNNIVLRGVKNINKVILRKVKDTLVDIAGSYKKQDIWVLDTIGTNLLDVLGLDYIDSTRTYSNDIMEIFDVLGIEAARQAIYNELADVIEFDGTYLNYHHTDLLCDRMTAGSKMTSIFRHGINNDDIGVIAKASFEETPEIFIKAAKHGELDIMRGISANVMCGQEGLFGTASFGVLLDMNEMLKLDEQKFTYQDTEILIEDGLFGNLESSVDVCSTKNLTMETNITNIGDEDLGDENDYNPFG